MGHAKNTVPLVFLTLAWLWVDGFILVVYYLGSFWADLNRREIS